MTLTAKQEQFCQGIASGLNQSDAYRAAYNAEKTKPDVVNVKASQLMANGKVSVRVVSLRDALANKALWTREDSVRALKQIADGVGGATKPGEAVSAIKELNAMHGFAAPVKADLRLSGGLVLIPAKA